MVNTIPGVMGEKRFGADQLLEAVERVGAADRMDLVKRLTKEMLLDPQRRIQLDDLVGQEVQRVLRAISDSVRVEGPLEGSGADQVVQIADSAEELWTLVAPFCASLQVAARWASPDVLAPWARALKSFVESANKSAAGVSALLEQRHLPGMVTAMTAGLACVANGKWENLRILLMEQTVKDRYQPGRLPLLETSDPYAPFGAAEWVPTPSPIPRLMASIYGKRSRTSRRREKAITRQPFVCLKNTSMKRHRTKRKKPNT